MLDKYTISNPIWVNQENTIINCTLTEKTTGQQFEFSANPLDSEAYGRQLYEDCINGVYGPIDPYQPTANN
jgi:hypothetical protein